MRSKTLHHDEGFTLLEVILAVSIMSLIVATLYMAFSQATRTWGTQNTLTDNAKRVAIVTDMLNREFISLRPYSFLGEKGKNYFFSISPTTLFYVTTQSFGAQRRTVGGLYFGCLYMASPDLFEKETDYEISEGDQALYLCKLDKPESWFLEELSDFRTMTQDQRESYTPSLQVREASVFLMGGFDEARFSCSDTTELPETQNATNPLEDLLARSANEPGFELADMDLDETTWTKKELPALLQLSILAKEEEVRLIQGSPSYYQE